MPHPTLGLDAVRRDVHAAPSRLARETELIDEVYTLLEPHLGGLDDLDDEDDAEAVEEAVAAIRTIAAGGQADADTAHEVLTTLAAEFEESGDVDDAATARTFWLPAAWLCVKTGRWLRSADLAPWEGFGVLVDVLALPRLDDDCYRQLLGEMERTLTRLGDVRALDKLFPAMDRLLDLVAAEDEKDAPGEPPLIGELRRFAEGADIDVVAVHGRIESVALSRTDDVSMESHLIADAAWTLAVWLRMRSGREFGYEPNYRNYYPPMNLRWLVEAVVWCRAGRFPEAMTTTFDPETDQLGLVRALRSVYRTVTGTDVSAPEISGESYAAGLGSVVERLSALPEARRLQVLYDWISPLLDEVAWENSEFLDEPEMTTAEAVERFRRIASGADNDADAVHWHLTYFGVVESEDQDADMHVRSQAAFLAADWLRLSTGRELRCDENELIDDYEPEPVDVARMVNTLAWTRSRQVSHRPEYVDDLIEKGHDLLTPIVELRAMRDDLSDQAAAS